MAATIPHAANIAARRLKKYPPTPALGLAIGFGNGKPAFTLLSAYRKETHMKVVQIDKYSKEIHTQLRDVPVPTVGQDEVLVKVKAAAVNPLELLILTGSVRLIQDYPMPLTLGNELSGVVEIVGGNVKGFQRGDRVYARLPLGRIGAFAEYVAVDSSALARMPEGCGFDTAAAIPLTGLTAYQGLTEVLEAKPGSTLLIPGGSGSFGEMAVPIAIALGLRVIVTGNDRARERFLAAGVERYLDYRKENYWEQLSGIDYVIDTLGAAEFERELSVLREGGRLLSLRTGPNREFALRNHYPAFKRMLFTAAGAKYDHAARRQGKEYRFMFVHSDGEQLAAITRIVESRHIVPAIDPHEFSIKDTDEALKLVSNGRINGKVLIRM